MKKKTLLISTGVVTVATAMVLGFGGRFASKSSNSLFLRPSKAQTPINFVEESITRRIYFTNNDNYWDSGWTEAEMAQMYIYAWQLSDDSNHAQSEVHLMVENYREGDARVGNIYYADVTFAGAGDAIGAIIKTHSDNSGVQSVDVYLPALWDSNPDFIFLNSGESYGKRNASTGSTSKMNSEQVAYFLTYFKTCDNAYADGYNAYPQILKDFFPTVREDGNTPMRDYDYEEYVENGKSYAGLDQKAEETTIGSKLAAMKAMYESDGYTADPTFALNYVSSEIFVNTDLTYGGSSFAVKAQEELDVVVKFDETSERGVSKNLAFRLDSLQDDPVAHENGSFTIKDIKFANSSVGANPIDKGVNWDLVSPSYFETDNYWQWNGDFYKVTINDTEINVTYSQAGAYAGFASYIGHLSEGYDLVKFTIKNNSGLDSAVRVEVEGETQVGSHKCINADAQCRYYEVSNSKSKNVIKYRTVFDDNYACSIISSLSGVPANAKGIRLTVKNDGAETVKIQTDIGTRNGDAVSSYLYDNPDDKCDYFETYGGAKRAQYDFAAGATRTVNFYFDHTGAITGIYMLVNSFYAEVPVAHYNGNITISNAVYIF